MIKTQELVDPKSCLSRAKDGEMVFTLLARDRAAPIVIYVWCILRVAFRKNTWNDDQLTEARTAAWIMKHQRTSGLLK